MATLVRDLMTSPVRTVTRATPLCQVRALMYEGDFRHVPVVDPGDAVAGVLSDRDLARVLGGTTSGGGRSEGLDDLPAELVMSWPADTVRADDPIAYACERMMEGKLGCLPVVEGRRLVGILTETDFVRHVARSHRPH